MAKKQKSANNLLEVQNAAKTMFANIRFQSIDNEIKTLLITSSVPDEGKTTAAWYLAQAAATAGHSVLLVECDMRRRSLASMLNLHPQHGLVAVLTGSATTRNAVVPTSVRGLYFLDAEPSVPNPADLLASKRMAQLNDQLAAQFDYVIYDTPPVGTFIDAAVLGRVVDGAILAVRPGKVKRQELEQSSEQLRNAEVKVLGICTTFVEGTGSEYYYSYYTKDHSKKKGDVALEEVPQNAVMPRQLVDRPAANNASNANNVGSSGKAANDGRSVPRSVPRINKPTGGNSASSNGRGSHSR